MEESPENGANQLKTKIKSGFSDPYNLSIIGILVFTIALRFYYFWITKNQPIWWDESEYMAAAKGYAGLGNYQLQGIRLPGFPILMSLFFMIGITSEPIMRFFALFLPSIALVIITYFMINQMYPDRRIALISTAIIAVLWENLFYSNRFQTENLSILFEFLAITVFFAAYLKNKDIWIIKRKYAWALIVFFVILSILIRPGNVFFVPALIIFAFVINAGWFFENNRRKYSLLIFAVILAISGFYILQNLSDIPFLSNFKTYYSAANPFAWNTLKVFYGFYQPQPSIIPALLFYAFIFGLFILTFDIITNRKKISLFRSNSEELTLKSDIFNILLISVVMILMIFFLRPYTGFEYRWFFPLLPGMLAISARGLAIASDYVKHLTTSRILAVLLIIAVLVGGIYSQLNYSDSIIKMKINSYQEVKDSGLWVKQNSNFGDSIVSASVPQHSYYSERKVYDFEFNGLASGARENITLFDEELEKLKPRYLVVSMFEPVFTPKWAYTWANENNSVPVKVYFGDAERKQPILIIYELKYS